MAKKKFNVGERLTYKPKHAPEGSKWVCVERYKDGSNRPLVWELQLVPKRTFEDDAPFLIPPELEARSKGKIEGTQSTFLGKIEGTEKKG